MEIKNLLIDTQHEFSELILEFSIVYKDALENLYESKFEINLNNRNTTTVNLKEATQILNQKNNKSQSSVKWMAMHIEKMHLCCGCN